MYTDLSGFSRGVENFGIIHFLQIIREQSRLFLPIVAACNGILLKTEADSLMLMFRRPESSLTCAVEMMRTSHQYNRNRPPEDQIRLCVGIGYGEVLRLGDTDVFGYEVNAACKLGEDVAKPDQILITDSALNELPKTFLVEVADFDPETPGMPKTHLIQSVGGEAIVELA
jgi:class 3 adenylate cyclase